MPTAMVAPISARKIRSWYKKHKSLESYRLIVVTHTMRTRSISGTDVHSKAITLIFITAHAPFPERIRPGTHAISQDNWYIHRLSRSPDCKICWNRRAEQQKTPLKKIRPLTVYIFINVAVSNESLWGNCGVFASSACRCFGMVFLYMQDIHTLSLSLAMD